MINYLYIDDEPEGSVNPFIKAIELYNEVKFEHIQPIDYETQITDIIDRQHRGGFDGLVLDLRLDKIANNLGKDSKPVNYRGATLAQEIRTRITEGPESGLLPCPIVLWSTETYLEESYWRDNTSHDLFDLRVDKQHILDIDGFAKKLSTRLVDLVEGYALITCLPDESDERPFNLLKVPEYELLDIAIAGNLVDSIEQKPVHEQARFILRQLLETPNNSLINEAIMAARLGLDIKESGDFFELVNNRFASAKYEGPFASGWPCWWVYLVEDLFEQLSEDSKGLRDLDAEARVQILREAFGLQNLVAATPMKFAKSNSYWNICQATWRPISLLDGFKTRRQPPYPWQNPFYISLEGVLEGYAADKNIKISPLEEQRYENEKNRVLANHRGKQAL